MGEMGNNDWTIGEIVAESWQRFARNWVTLVFANLIILIIAIAPLIVWLAVSIPAMIVMAHKSAVPSEAAVWSLATSGGCAFAVVLLVTALFSPAQLRIALAAASGGKPRIADVFRDFSRAWPLYLLGLFTAVVCLFAALPLLVPAVILGLGWTLAPYFVVDGQRGVFAALGASWRAMRGSKARLFGLIVLFTLASMAFSIICQVTVFLVPVAWLMGLVTGPFFMQMTSFLYLRLKPLAQQQSLAAAA